MWESSMCMFLRGSRTSRSLISSRLLTSISACTTTTYQMSLQTQNIFWLSKKRIILGMNQWPAVGSPRRTCHSIVKLKKIEWEGNAIKTVIFTISGITVSFVEIGTSSRSQSWQVRKLFSPACLATSIRSNTKWASKDVWGITICAPLSNKTSSFIGAYCTDIYPSTGYTGDGSIKDNYLNMYLSQTYSNTSNYIIFKSDSFVSKTISLMTKNKYSFSGMGTSQSSTR